MILLTTTFIFIRLSSQKITTPNTPTVVALPPDTNPTNTSANTTEKTIQEAKEQPIAPQKGWVSVGQPGFTQNRASNISLKFNRKDNFFYTAFRDEETPNQGKVTVKKFDGTSWKIVGTPEFSPVNVYSLDLEINPADGNPYVIFNQDLGLGSHSYDEGGSYVMKFNGNQWEIVGGKSFDSSSINNLSMGFNPASGQIYVAYNKGMYLNIRKFDGNSWKDIGKDIAFRPSDAQNYNSSNIIFDSETSQPWIAYSDKASPGKIYIMRYENNGRWMKNIITAPTSGFINDISLTISPVTKQLYLSYNSNGLEGNSPKLNIFKFNGTGLEPIGLNKNKTGAVASTSKLIFNPINKEPYIAYSTTTNPGKVSIMKFSNAEWTSIGNLNFSQGDANYIDINFDNLGIPYVAYQDFANNAKMSIMKYIE